MGFFFQGRGGRLCRSETRSVAEKKSYLIPKAADSTPVRLRICKNGYSIYHAPSSMLVWLGHTTQGLGDPVSESDILRSPPQTPKPGPEVLGTCYPPLSHPLHWVVADLRLKILQQGERLSDINVQPYALCAPEAIPGLGCGPAADIWSLGAFGIGGQYVGSFWQGNAP